MLRQRWSDLRDDEEALHRWCAGKAPLPGDAVAASAVAAGPTHPAWLVPPSHEEGGADGDDGDGADEDEEPLTLGERVEVAGPGGINGRPGKPGDTCYAFWIGASLTLCGIDPAGAWDTAGLAGFLARCQFPGLGGFGKDCEAYSDPMHTYYGVAGAALAGIGAAGSFATFRTTPVEPALSITHRALAAWWRLAAVWHAESAATGAGVAAAT